MGSIPKTSRTVKAPSHINPYLPVMPQKLPGFVVGVAQIYSTDKTRGVQMSEVRDVCSIFRNLLWERKGHHNPFS